MESKGKIGIHRLSSLAEKIVWIRDNLPGVMEEDVMISNGRNIELVKIFL